MLRFYNGLYDFLPIDIIINNRLIVAKLKPNAFSCKFNAKPGLYTITVASGGETLLHVNFQLRSSNSVIIFTGKPNQAEMRVVPRTQKRNQSADALVSSL